MLDLGAPAAACRRPRGSRPAHRPWPARDRTWLPCPPAPPARLARTRPCVVAHRRTRRRRARPAPAGTPRRPWLLVTGSIEDRRGRRRGSRSSSRWPPSRRMRRAHEELERHEGRDRVAGQPEQQRGGSGRIAAVVAGGTGRPERERLARLDRHPPEVDRAEFLEGGADHVVRPDRDAARHDDGVGALDRGPRTAGRGRRRSGPRRSRGRAPRPRPPRPSRRGRVRWRRGCPAGPRALPGARTSSPVARIPTTGRRWH